MIKSNDSSIQTNFPRHLPFLLKRVKKFNMGRISPLLFLLFLILPFFSSAQIALPKNESLLYSFKTRSGKSMLLSMKNSDQSVCYRYGTNKKIELEFCSGKNEEHYKMNYSFYLRGGGPANEGMDLNYVYFTKENFQYVIFDTYSAVENKKTTGIKVIDLKTKAVTELKADPKSIKGNLIQFRDNQLLQIGEELFD